VRTYRRALKTAIPTRTTHLPRVTLVLDALFDHSFVSVLTATNARGVVLPALDQLDIADYFADVITDDALESHQRKPDPETVLRACRDHGIHPADTIVIGDTTLDVQMGHAAGAATIAVTWGYHRPGDLADARPTELVDDPVELGAVLRARVGEQVGERTR
jgi:phosphoglycolate phosphatase